jgi:hypothetical protein
VQHLPQPQRPLHLGHPQVQPDPRERRHVGPAAGRLRPLLRRAHGPVVAEPPHLVRERVVVEQHHPALAGRDHLARMKRQALDRRPRPAHHPVVAPAERAAPVAQHRQARTRAATSSSHPRRPGTRTGAPASPAAGRRSTPPAPRAAPPPPCSSRPDRRRRAPAGPRAAAARCRSPPTCTPARTRPSPARRRGPQRQLESAGPAGDRDRVAPVRRTARSPARTPRRARP